MLRSLPDLERGVCRVFNGSCSAKDFCALLRAFTSLLDALPASRDVAQQFGSSPFLVRLLDGGGHAARVRESAQAALAVLDEQAAKDGNMQRLFRRPCTEFSEVEELAQSIERTEQALQQQHLAEARQTLKLPTLQYKTVSGQEYLLEVANAATARVPSNWAHVSQTKKVKRYRSPAVVSALAELERARERLTIAVASAWRSFLSRFAQRFAELRGLVSAVATIDALLALADIAALPGYVAPELLDASGHDDGPLLEARAARHPVLETLGAAMGTNSYVPNDISIGLPHRCLVVTGPNMGGKAISIFFFD